MKTAFTPSWTLCALAAALLQALPAHADGNHYGWCQGVHNPHSHMGCTGGGGYNGGSHTDTPTVNGGHNGDPTTGPQGQTPQSVTVVVPADTGPTVSEPQNNPGAVAAKPQTTTQVQETPTIQLPRPKPVVGPPQTFTVSNTPSQTTVTPPPEGPHYVDGPMMQAPPSLPAVQTQNTVPQVMAVPPTTIAVQRPRSPCHSRPRWSCRRAPAWSRHNLRCRSPPSTRRNHWRNSGPPSRPR